MKIIVAANMNAIRFAMSSSSRRLSSGRRSIDVRRGPGSTARSHCRSRYDVRTIRQVPDRSLVRARDADDGRCADRDLRLLDDAAADELLDNGTVDANE